MRKAIKTLSIILSVLCSGVFGLCISFEKSFPDEFMVYKNENISFNDFNTISFNNQSKNEIAVNSDINGISYAFRYYPH